MAVSFGTGVYHFGRVYKASAKHITLDAEFYWKRSVWERSLCRRAIMTFHGPVVWPR